MSAGLMSCVRENSPPIENGDGTRSNSEHVALSGSVADTGKLKKIVKDLNRFY